MAKAKMNNGPILPSRNLTPEEQAIVSRVESQDHFEHISEESMEDFSLATDPLLLPPIAMKLQKRQKYAFRWCERRPSRVDELTRAAQPPLRWGIVTRTTIPELSSEVDDILGCVCRLDQLLLYKPWSHHMMVKRAKEELAGARDRKGDLTSRHGERTGQGEMYAQKSTLSERNPYKISGGDEVMASEEAFDSDLGELVVDNDDE